MTGTSPSRAKGRLVSIVLPTFNRADLLAVAIDSILSQSYTNIELIIINDNSHDHTESVVCGFEDPRIIYIKNKENLKLPRALNKGFSLSSGEYLTWTSDDNIYANSAIDKMVSKLEEGKADFVYADYFEFSDLDKTNIPICPRIQSLPDHQKFELSNQVGGCFMYTRKVYEIVGDYDPDLFLVEDYDYFIRISRNFDMVRIAEPIYYFRRDDDTLYYSRFSEVKASDVLVRYKNGLISEEDAIKYISSLIVKNISRSNYRAVRFLSRVVRRVSYRFNCYFERAMARHVERRISGEVVSLLEDFGREGRSFKLARDRLCELMASFAIVRQT